jgi:Tol biopolymer transport system component
LTRLTFDPGLDRSPVWSPDGRRIAFSSQTESGIGSLSWQFADGSGTVEKLTNDTRTQQFPTSFSPDGTKLLFWEIGQAETAWDMGVFDFGAKGTTTPPGATFTHDSPRMLFDGPYAAPQVARTYDVSPDGQRFLMIKRAPQKGGERDSAPKLVLVQNWLEELKRRVPAR